MKPSTDVQTECETSYCFTVQLLLLTAHSDRRDTSTFDSSLVAKTDHLIITSGYAMWFTAGGAILIAHYDVIDDAITRKLLEIEKNGDHLAP